MYINVSRVKDAITGSYNGVAFGVLYNKEKYDAMKALELQANSAATIDEVNAVIEEFKPLTVESYKELAETKCPYIFVNGATNKFYLKLKGKICKEALPSAFAKRIIKSVDEGIDFMPLIKAWIRFLRNPNYSEQKGRLFANYLNHTYTDYSAATKAMQGGLSQDKALELNTRLQTPLTQEGLMVTYKVVTELTEKWILDAEGHKKQVPRWTPNINEDSGVVTYDEPEFIEDRVFEPCVMGPGGDAFSCGTIDDTNPPMGHIVKVGCVHALDSWDKVNTHDGTFGAMGLHAGNLDYIRGYQAMGTATLNIFIDPQDIGRFTNDGDGAVICKKFYAYGAFSGVNRGMYHSSDYAELGDSEYQTMLAASIVQYGELQQDTQDKIDLANDIATTDVEVPATATKKGK